MFTELYPHQDAAVEAAYERKRPGWSGLWSMPPGTGRTTAAVCLARHCHVPALLLVHAEGLIDPALGIIREVWPHAQVGVVTAYEGPSNWSDCRIVVAARDRLNSGFLCSLPEEAFRLVIVDDCHLDRVSSWGAVTHHFGEAFVLGVAATADDIDQESDLMVCFGREACYTYTLAQAIKDGRCPKPAQAPGVPGGRGRKSRGGGKGLTTSLPVPPALAGYKHPARQSGRGWPWQWEPVTMKQLNYLCGLGYGDCRGLTKGPAHYLLDRHESSATSA
jgi:hypothetical protein